RRNGHGREGRREREKHEPRRRPVRRADPSDHRDHAYAMPGRPASAAGAADEVAAPRVRAVLALTLQEAPAKSRPRRDRADPPVSEDDLTATRRAKLVELR